MSVNDDSKKEQSEEYSTEEEVDNSGEPQWYAQYYYTRPCTCECIQSSLFHSNDVHVPGPASEIDHPTSHKQSLLPHGRLWAIRDALLIDPSAKTLCLISMA